MTNQNPFTEDDLIASLARESNARKEKRQKSFTTFLTSGQAKDLSLRGKTQETRNNVIPDSRDPWKSLIFRVSSIWNPKSQANYNKTKLNYNFNPLNMFNLTHLTKLSFAALTIFTLLAGGVAAQALAPNELKPTQVAQTIKDKYFGANKQKDADPAVALVPDMENKIVKLDLCNQTYKVPKLLSSQNLIEQKFSGEYFENLTFSKENLEQGFSYLVGCLSEKIQSSQIDSLYISLDEYNSKYSNEKFIPEDFGVEKNEMSQEQLKKETGWFSSNNSIEKIMKITKNDTRFMNQKIVFKYKSYYYIIEIQNFKNETPINFSDFQIQFQDQVK
jgi:hypothetical protein